jgi:hypothetical protein
VSRISLASTNLQPDDVQWQTMKHSGSIANAPSRWQLPHVHVVLPHMYSAVNAATNHQQLRCPLPSHERPYSALQELPNCTAGPCCCCCFSHERQLGPLTCFHTLNEAKDASRVPAHSSAGASAFKRYADAAAAHISGSLGTELPQLLQHGHKHVL